MNNDICALTSGDHFTKHVWVLRGLVLKCLIRNPGVLGSSRTRSSNCGFSWECPSEQEQDTSEPKPSNSETQNRHEENFLQVDK